MNRHALAEATSLHDGPVPVYLMEEIATSTKVSDRDAEKAADYILGRLNKSNLNVKLKALQVIVFCIREGSSAFVDAIRDDEQELSAYTQFSGPPDPVYGDEKYRRIRVASQEALVCLNDGFLVRRNEEPQQHKPSQEPTPSWQMPREEQLASYSNSNAACHSGQPERQHPSVGGSWGQPLASSRPAPYHDNPPGHINANLTGSTGGIYHPSVGRDRQSAGFNASSGPYNGTGGDGSHCIAGQSHGTFGSYQTSARGEYSQTAPSLPQASGFNSWSTSSGTGLATNASGAGVWSSSGYQKKDHATTMEPRYNPSTSRDNRPTVLVGHSLSFPKPAGGFGRSNSGAMSGLGGFHSGTYNSNEVRGAPARNMNAFNHMEASARATYGGHQSAGAPSSYMDNSSRHSHRIGSLGLPVNTQPIHEAPTTALGKKAEVLKKMGSAALEKWDRRNMDKSMASSLADNDELRAGPHVFDRGYYEPNVQHGTGGGDTSRDYERTMIDSLCAPAGLSRAPSAEGLKRFLDLAQTLDVQTIGDILLDKLEDDTWQVRLKGLHVVLGLLDSPGAAPYQEFFEDHVDLVEELRKDAKPSVVAKAVQVLRVLGYANEAVHAAQPNARRSSTARPPRGSPTKTSEQEVDLLGLDSLSLDLSTGPSTQRTPATSNLLDTTVRSQPVLPPQELSLLDGF